LRPSPVFNSSAAITASGAEDTATFWVFQALSSWLRRSPSPSSPTAAQSRCCLVARSPISRRHSVLAAPGGHPVERGWFSTSPHPHSKCLETTAQSDRPGISKAGWRRWWRSSRRAIAPSPLHYPAPPKAGEPILNNFSWATATIGNHRHTTSKRCRHIPERLHPTGVINSAYTDAVPAAIDRSEKS